ncbi:MAG: cupin domain-containing protein [Candidatus Brocadiia bacterium]
MKHVHYSDVEAQNVDLEGASGVRVRWLIDDSDGAPNFYMRRFDLEPGGMTPHHEHDWEHEVYILEGSGVAVTEDGERPFEPGDVFFMPGGERHRFRAGEDGAAFICLIPKSGKGCGAK